MDNFAKACTEVCEVFEFLDDNYINSIPKKFMEFLKENQDINYKKDLDAQKPLENQNLLQETIDLLALIKLTYWCKDDKEKAGFQNLLYENEKKYQQDIKEKYNPDNLFKKKVLDNTEENIQLVEYKKENIFEKILKRIKDFFRKLNHKE